jgi:hypothetical protein
MRESGGHACLAQETLTRRGSLSEVCRQDFDRDVAVELDIAREVNDPHATTAELVLKRVLTGHGGLQVKELGRGMSHGLEIRAASRSASAEQLLLLGFRKAHVLQGGYFMVQSSRHATKRNPYVEAAEFTFGAAAHLRRAVRRRTIAVRPGTGHYLVALRSGGTCDF